MAKNSIPDFSATAASNTDIQSVNIDENCPASGINNAIRELMVDLKNMDTGAVALTSPKFATASITDASAQISLTRPSNSRAGVVKVTNANGGIEYHSDVNGSGETSIAAHTFTGDAPSNNTNYMTILGSGNIGLGTSSPSVPLHQVASAPRFIMQASGSITSGTRAQIDAANSDGSTVANIVFGAVTDNVGSNIQFSTRPASGSLSERMRIDSSGNLLVGTTSYDGSHFNESSGGGFAVTSAGKIDMKVDGTVANFNRTSSADGDVLYFAKQGAKAGSIGIQSSGFFIDGESGHEGIRFANGAITPRENGSDSDGSSDLGASNNRFKDGYFSNIVYSTYLRGQNDTDTGIDVGDGGSAANTLIFHTGGSERARLSGANLFVGKTSDSQAGVGITVGGSGFIRAVRNEVSGVFHRTSSDGSVILFERNSSTVGSISVTTSGTTFNTSSDRRLKQDIEPLVATDKLMAMNPVSHAWKANPDGPRSVGFIAQEMEELCPDAVSTDNTDEAMMSMDYGRITPILVSALQDAHRKIEQLENRIAALEA